MMLSVLRRVEDVLVQVVRVVLLAFSLVVLIALALWVWGSWQGKSDAQTDTAQPIALNWKEAKLDVQFMVDETGRDLGHSDSQAALAERLADAQLRTSYQQADRILRTFVSREPAMRAHIEKTHDGQGLAPLNPLLQGNTLPDPALADRMRQAESAAEAAASSEEDAAFGLNDPVDIPAAIHERAQMAEMEHGAGSYAAYVQGLPAALEQVLGNKALAPRLEQQPAANLVNMVLTNYTLGFDRAARALRGDSETEEPGSIWDLYSKAMETTFWSMLMTILVLVVMVVVFIRMERHLRVISEQATRKADERSAH